MTTLAGKTAVVTGGSRGIGRAIVRRLAADGARVVFSFREDKAAADALAEEIGDAVAVRADQEDLGSLDALFEPVAGGLDILVNNAAITAPAPISDITPELFDQAMTVNAKFPLLAMQRAEPLLREGGRIVNISTLNAALPPRAWPCTARARPRWTSSRRSPPASSVRAASPSTPSHPAPPTPTCCARATLPKRWSSLQRSPPWGAWALPPISRTRSPSWSALTAGGSPDRTFKPPAATSSDALSPASLTRSASLRS
jgi:NAD(P)-dependent dehydrogenase (short-subunit alcohol dehydrogenase family)